MTWLQRIRAAISPRNDAAYARWVLWMLAILFPLWGWMMPAQASPVIDPAIARLTVSAIAIAVILGSYARDTAVRGLQAYVAFCWACATMVAVWLAWANPQVDGYVLQLVALMGSGGLVVRDARHVRWFWTAVLVAWLVAMAWKPELPDQAGMLGAIGATLFLLHAIVGVRERTLQDQILERTTLLREVFENATDALFLVDPSSRQVLLANQRATEMFAAPVLDALLDRDVLDFPARALTDDEVSHIWEASQGTDEYRMEVPFRRFEGRPFWGDAAWRSIDMGNRRWTLLRITPIDDRIHTQRALERARDAAEAATQAKSSFLANMSHEIRTPLNGVLGLASLLERSDLSKEQASYVTTILSSGRTLLSLIDELLDFSRIEAGELVSRDEPFDLRACLDDLRVLFGTEADNKDLDFVVTIDPDVPREVITDGARVRQVIVNLIGNALKFTETGGVTVTCSVDATLGDRVWFDISVRDSGIGIDEDDLPRLFEPFSQADPGITRRFGGTGLGLAISRRIAGHLGGTLEATSTPGEGSTFRLHFPATPTDGVAQITLPDRPRAPLKIDGARPVLVAEDNPVNRMVILEMLKRSGCDADAVENGAEAVQCMKERTYDIVFMDVMMPELDGLEATRRIRAMALPRRPYIVALTAGVLPRDRAQCIDAGMDDFVAKPVQLTDVQQALSRAATHLAREDIPAP